MNKLKNLDEESVFQIAINITDENDNVFDLKTEEGIDQACQYAVDFHESAGYELKFAEIKRALKQRISELQMLDTL